MTKKAAAGRSGAAGSDPMRAAERARGLVEGMLRVHRRVAEALTAHAAGEKVLSAGELARLADEAERVSASNAEVKAEVSAANRHALEQRRALQLLVSAAARASGEGNHAEVGLLGLAGTARELIEEAKAQESARTAPSGREGAVPQEGPDGALGEGSAETPEEAPTLG